VLNLGLEGSYTGRNTQVEVSGMIWGLIAGLDDTNVVLVSVV
jgi:hypothetical protein